MTDRSFKILIVDDDIDIRLLLDFNLSKAGYEVMEAADGAEALDIIKEHQVDLVVTDITMPVMDGYELIKQLRRTENQPTVPVLMLTGREEARVAWDDLEYPPDDYLAKPFNENDLMPKIKKLLLRAD